MPRFRGAHCILKGCFPTLISQRQHFALSSSFFSDFSSDFGADPACRRPRGCRAPVQAGASVRTHPRDHVMQLRPFLRQRPQRRDHRRVLLQRGLNPTTSV
eukprot:2584809-Rhodomonas_salina.1